MAVPGSKYKYSSEEDKAMLPFMTHLGANTASLLPFSTSRSSHKPFPESDQEELDSLLDGGVARSYTRRTRRMGDIVAAILENAISLLTCRSQSEIEPCGSHNIATT